MAKKKAFLVRRRGCHGNSNLIDTVGVPRHLRHSPALDWSYPHGPGPLESQITEMYLFAMSIYCLGVC